MEFRRRRGPALAALALLPALLFSTGPVSAAPEPPPESLGAHSPDPDTAAVFIDGKERYVTVTTDPRDSESCGGQSFNLPYFVHGNARQLGFEGHCPDGDLLPSSFRGEPIEIEWDGVSHGAKNLWAPSLSYFQGEFYLYYAGALPDSGRRCIWSLHAPTLGELKFATRSEFACPDRGLAIDPDVFEHDGRLYVTYRFDPPGLARADSALYVTEVGTDGLPVGEPRELLRGSAHSWATYRRSAKFLPSTIENPSMVYNSATGQWLVFYSGSRWSSKSYATGVATCGSHPLEPGRCQPLSDSPYVGYSKAKGRWWGEKPLYDIPGDLPGAGGMSVFTTHHGDTAAVWHAWDNGAPHLLGSSGLRSAGGDERSVRRAYAGTVRLPSAVDEPIVFEGGPVEAPKCRGEWVTVRLDRGEVPSDGDDVVLGTPENDLIFGRDGNDRICGLGGNDIVVAGPGDDIVFAGPGRDVVDGSEGDDQLRGGFGSDRLYGSEGQDTLVGGPGTDECSGGAGKDTDSGCENRIPSLRSAGDSLGPPQDSAEAPTKPELPVFELSDGS